MITLASLAAAAISAAPCALPPLRPGPPPFRPGDALAWDLDVMGVAQAGTIQAELDSPSRPGGPLPLRARARNTSVFAKVRRVRAVATAWLDPRTLRPERYRDEADEEGVRRTTEVSFAERGPTVTLRWTHGERRGTREFERRGDVTDLLSAVYYLRAADLAPGRELCFDLVANRRYWRLTGAVAPGTEKVETPAGAFEAVRLDATLTRLATPDDARVRSRPLHLWFSADERRVPVAAVSEVDLGPVRALLSRGAKPLPKR